MLFTSIGLMLAFLNAAVATKKTPLVVNYDEFKDLNAVFGIQPPEPYNFLKYTGYIIGAPVPNSVTIQPSSAENAIFAPYVLAGGPLVQPIFFSNYTGTKVSSFDLKSIADGCYAGTQSGVLAPAINCTIRYTATKRGGKVVTYDSDFRVPLGTALKAFPVKTHTFPMPDFSDLVEVRPSVLEAKLPVLAVQMAFDDMAYVVTSK